MLAFRAKYVFPIDGPPLRDGVVAIDHDRIVAVGESSSSTIRDLLPSARDLGDVVILPGLVNPHTHLEFSDLCQPVGPPGVGLPDWIRTVVRRRSEQEERLGQMRETELLEQINQGGIHAPEQLGIEESIESGITAIGNIELAVRSHSGRRESCSCSAPGKSPLELSVFLEVIAFREDVQADVRCALDEALQMSKDRWKETERLALSPHAPYSVHPEFISYIVSISKDRRIPLAHHLAESREEMMLLRAGTGPFVDLLKYLEAWDPDAIPFGSRPLDYLQMLSKAHRALVIHGNYLDDEEIGFLGAHADNMSVIYCPRTHAFFQHDPYPLAKMIAAGVNVAIGTDSRASNPDLSVLADMRFAAKQHPIVPPATLLRMITVNAARSLGRHEEIGTLTPGKFADLAILALPKQEPIDPYELLFDMDCRVIATIFRGRAVFGDIVRLSSGDSPGAK